MNCYEIISNYVKKVGGDGLCNPEIGCGCHLEDRFACDSAPDNCVAAKWTDCDKCDVEKPCEIQSDWGNDGCYKAIMGEIKNES